MAKHVGPLVLGAVAASVLDPHPPHQHPPHHGPRHRPHALPPRHAPKPEGKEEAEGAAALPAVHGHPHDVAPKDLDEPKGRLTMEGQLRAARWSLERFLRPHNLLDELLIPQWVLRKAKGIVFLSVVKAGFVFAANVGTGCIITRKADGGWSGPSSVGVGGLSFGFQAGASKVEYIMVLTKEDQVRQFSGKGQLRLGGEIQIAVGPMGRNGHGSVGANSKGLSVVFTYSHSQGLFGGLALDGKVLSVRSGCNNAFYGKEVHCADILSGKMEDFPKNADYDAIVHLLDRHSKMDAIYSEIERDDAVVPVAEDKAVAVGSDVQCQNDREQEAGHTVDGDDCAPDEFGDEGVDHGARGQK